MTSQQLRAAKTTTKMRALKAVIRATKQDQTLIIERDYAAMVATSKQLSGMGWTVKWEWV